ncbi:hypothetical protein [Planktothrix sp.]|uniref:hypothetical protein n=1 Tax=Planktothrix sp. TaxID=3088171 RepID=UPI0038D49B75
MPIIPLNYTGLSSVNAIGSINESGNTSFGFCASFPVSFSNDKDYVNIIGECTESIKRQLSLTVVSGSCLVYWMKNETELFLINQKKLDKGYELKDNDLDKLGITIKAVNTPCEIFIVLRWNNDLDFYLFNGDELMIKPQVRLLLGTGDNYVNRNVNDFDSGSYQYLINLNKLKNSDENRTGYKLFDIFSFYPGKNITFNVTIDSTAINNYQANSIAVQLFDPIDIGEALFDIANDVINLELNNISNGFVGQLTRNALYKVVTNNSVIISPDFSRHTGRFVAINTNTGMYDTCIIKSYEPNTIDTFNGGTFTLTGGF